MWLNKSAKCLSLNDPSVKTSITFLVCSWKNHTYPPAKSTVCWLCLMRLQHNKRSVSWVWAPLFPPPRRLSGCIEGCIRCNNDGTNSITFFGIPSRRETHWLEAQTPKPRRGEHLWNCCGNGSCFYIIFIVTNKSS